MRYLLSTNMHGEQAVRQQYLYDVFQVWFVRTRETDGFITLQAFPFTYENDILIFYGHNKDIRAYLKSHGKSISEKNIFIISCSLYDNKDYILSGKKTYLSIDRNCFTHLLIGKEYGFDFNITECELNLYNNSCSTPLEKLTSSLVRLKKGKRKNERTFR